MSYAMKLAAGFTIGLVLGIVVIFFIWVMVTPHRGNTGSTKDHAPVFQEERTFKIKVHDFTITKNVDCTCVPASNTENQ